VDFVANEVVTLDCGLDVAVGDRAAFEHALEDALNDPLDREHDAARRLLGEIDRVDKRGVDR
jgi:hypothetical protein